MVILDTNVIIDHLRQPRGAATLFGEALERYGAGEVGISILSVQELYEGKSMSNESKKQDAEKAIGQLEILPYSLEIAQLGGEIARYRSMPTDFPDAAIAATALLNGGNFLTYNKKDFQDIKGLVLI